MITDGMTAVTGQSDAELVVQSLDGNRDAFGQIVVRYQSLVCSLAYSATGSVAQSEDLAQDTFITAWKHLAGLREPEKLCAWLCGIARNLINNWRRRQGREPSHGAEPLETISESAASEPLPVDQAVSREEEAVLWRSLERIPEIYREPLVLFYREHQSAGRVAQALELSEDAVHQRLSRGRKLLQEQVLAFVEGTLERTRPNKAFTVGVLAALPLMATSTKAATTGATAAKGGAMVTATGLTAFFGVILKFIIPVGAFISLGGWLGYKMGSDAGQTPSQRESVARFWGILLASIVLFAFLPMLMGAPLMHLFGSKSNLLTVIRIWLDVMFAIILAALALWAWQRKSRPQPIAESPRKKGTSFFIWLVALATLFTAIFLADMFSDANWKVQYIDAAAAKRLIEEKSGQAEFFVMQSRNGERQLWIEFLENGKVCKNIVPADYDTVSLLNQKGIQYPTYVEGYDWDVFGWQGRMLAGLCLFVFASGVAVLLTLFRQNTPPNPIMTKTTQIGIVAAIFLAALIIIPLVVLNHRKANTIQPNAVHQTALTTEQTTEARQTAQSFFDALGKSDWNKIATLCPPGYSLGDELTSQQKDAFKGVQLISLGEPYKKYPYPGVYVPYDIRFKDGEEKNFNLAVRNDNPEQKWYFDGGF